MADREIAGSFPQAHFGSVGADANVDWRKELTQDEPDDDEELLHTPPDVAGMLGFEPDHAAKSLEDALAAHVGRLLHKLAGKQLSHAASANFEREFRAALIEHDKALAEFLKGKD